MQVLKIETFFNKKKNLKVGSSGQEKTFHHSQLPEIFSSGSKPMWNRISRTKVI